MKITRREAIKLGLIGGGSLLTPFGFQNSALADESNRGCPPHPRDDFQGDTSIQFSPQIEPFQLAFQKPPLLKPIRSDDLRDYYEIKMQKHQVEILPDVETEVWSYNDPTILDPETFIGPIIRQPKLRRSAVRFINELDTDAEGRKIYTSIHLHGMASLPQYDGYAEDLIPPNHYKDYYYPNNRASTLFYHDHAVGRTSRNAYMGLTGMYIVEYAQEDFVDPADCGRLPKGNYEVPLIIQDKRFASNGRLVFDDRGQRGLYGDVMLVNGVPWPRMEVAKRKYRFRVLNAGTSRTLQLALSRDAKSVTKGDKLIVIAGDAGLLSQPVVIGTDAKLTIESVELKALARTLRIGVAERYEFIIDFSEYSIGTRVFLQNPVLQSNADSDARSQAIMCFEVKHEETDDSSIPLKLGKVRPIDEILKSENLTLAQVRRENSRTFRFERNNGQWKINNQTWDPQRVDANPDLCKFEVWNLVNTGGGWVHPVHIHLVDLRLVSRNGRPPLPYESGWKDVFNVGEFETVQVLTKFIPHEGKYMMHCHNLVHEDHDMMTQFEVGEGGCDPCSAPAKPLPAPSGYDPPTCIPPETCCHKEQSLCQPSKTTPCS